jgi:hypothetical protein
MMKFELFAAFSRRIFAIKASMRLAIPAAAMAAGVLAAGAPDACAAPITLGVADAYGILLGTGDTLKLAGGFNIAGNVGLGNSDTLNRSGTNAISGTEYRDSSLTTSGSGSVSVSGGIITQSMTAAISAAASAATNAAALTGTAGLQNQNGSISLSNSSITIKALTNLSENVLNISSLSLANSTLTFDDNGFTGAKFIINVTGGFTVSSSGGSGQSIIQGINGATSADILFNIEGSSGTVSITGKSTNQIIGTILAPSRNVTVGGGGTLTGAIIAGVNNISGSSTVQSNSGGFNLSASKYVAQAPTSTPEPSSIALFGAGGLALLAVRRRHSSRR